MRRFVLFAALALCACSSDHGPASNAGTLTVALTAGGAADGGIVLVVSGGPVDSVTAPAGYQVAANTDGAGTHIMVLGNLAIGTLATITVPDRSLAAAYVVTVVQVSDRNSYGLLDAGPYRVSVRP